MLMDPSAVNHHNQSKCKIKMAESLRQNKNPKSGPATKSCCCQTSLCVYMCVYDRFTGEKEELMTRSVIH